VFDVVVRAHIGVPSKDTSNVKELKFWHSEILKKGEKIYNDHHSASLTTQLFVLISPYV
jgi:hypothetical protein